MCFLCTVLSFECASVTVLWGPSASGAVQHLWTLSHWLVKYLFSYLHINKWNRCCKRAASSGPAGLWEVVPPVLLPLRRLQPGAAGSAVCRRLQLQGVLYRWLPQVKLPQRATSRPPRHVSVSPTLPDAFRVQAPRCAACHSSIVPTEVSLGLRKCHEFNRNEALCLVLSGVNRVHPSGFIQPILPCRMLRWRGQPHLRIECLSE